MSIASRCVTTIWLASIAAVSFSGRVPSMAASAALISVCSLGRRLNSACTKSLLVVPKVSSNVSAISEVTWRWRKPSGASEVRLEGYFVVVGSHDTGAPVQKLRSVYCNAKRIARLSVASKGPCEQGRVGRGAPVRLRRRRHVEHLEEFAAFVQLGRVRHARRGRCRG